jgi:hypothetical protein
MSNFLSTPRTSAATSGRTTTAFRRRLRSAVISTVVLGMSTVGLGVAATAPAAAANRTVTYYVDAAIGSDANPGTSPTKAWKTLAKVNATDLQPGTTVRFQRGQTWTGALNVSESGTAAQPVQIRAYGEGARPMIRGGSSCLNISGSYVVVAYVHAHDCDWAGFDISGDNVDVNHVSASGSVAGVFVGTGSSDAKITYSSIYNNTKMSVLTKSPDYDDSGAFGVALNGTRTEVAYNTISGHEAFSYDFGTDGSAVEIYESSFNSIHHNVIKQSSGFELGGTSSQGNMIAFNQLYSTKATSEAFVTRGGGDQFGPVKDTLFANNSVYYTGAQSKGLVCYAGCSAAILTARNNIIVTPNASAYADGALKEDHNIFWGGGSVQLKAGLGVGSPSRGPRPSSLRTAFVAFARAAGTLGSACEGQGRSVRTSGPSAVIATVCSLWAPRDPSRLRRVQPSGSV